MSGELTVLQQRFVDEYLSDENLGIKDAALRAGYSEGFSSSDAYYLTRNPKIAAAIDKAMAARARRTRITHDRVLREIASLAFSNIDDYEIDDAGRVHLREGADIRAMKAISSMKRTITYDKDGGPRVVTELKLWDKGAAQEKLMRHLNLYKDDNNSGATKVAVLSKDTMDFAQKFLANGGDDADEE